MDDRIMGPRHSLVRSALQAGVVTGGPQFYDQFKQRTLREKVPSKNRTEALQYLADLARASGIDVDEAVVPAVRPNDGDAKLGDEIEAGLAEADDDGFGFDHSTEQVGSPLAKAVREAAKAWQPKDIVKFLWKPFMFESQVFYLVSSWRLRLPGFEWNLTGTTGNNPVLHRCGPDVLHFENESAISYNADFDLNWAISKEFTESLHKGTTQKVQATVFVWLVKYVPEREFRFWLNEKRDNPPKGVKPKIDIWTRRVTMKPLV